MPLRGPRRRDHDVVGRRHQQAHLHRLVRIGLGLGLGLGFALALALALALGLPPTGVPHWRCRSDDNASVKPKMLYASSKDALKKGLSGINEEYQATECACKSTGQAS